MNNIVKMTDCLTFATKLPPCYKIVKVGDEEFPLFLVRYQSKISGKMYSFYEAKEPKND